VLDLVRPRWLLALLAAIAFAYLAPHYELIAHDFGGIFSGGSPIQNASGAHGTYHAGAEATTAQIVRALAGGMWLAAIAAIVRWRSALGRMAIPATLAFSPFVILAAQNYGGEAIYRVFLFSAPWCALLIAWALCEVHLPRRAALRWSRRASLRWPIIGGVCVVVLFAGLQGLYGPVTVDAFSSGEVNASRWLYANIPRGSLIVLPVDNFPVLETADYNAYEVQIMPADPQVGASWLNEGNLPEVKAWIADLGHTSAYVVVSRSMNASADYFGAPKGYATLVRTIPSALGGSVVYRNSDATIYRVNLG
jgi:hypothetical protein